MAAIHRRRVAAFLQLAVVTALILEVSCEDFDYKHFGIDWTGTCKSGDSQSPINILTAKTTKSSTKLFSLNYEVSSMANITTNGKAIVVVLDPASRNILNTPDGPYRLVQFHFHTFSEHALDGLFGPLEAHFVHANFDATKLAVFGVVFRLDPLNARNPFLANFVDVLPNNTATKVPVTLSLKSFLQPRGPSSLSYYTYGGSLTTPPCSEIVTWYVRQQFATAAVEDVEAFLADELAVTGDPLNDRLPQPLRGRKVSQVRVSS